MHPKPSGCFPYNSGRQASRIHKHTRFAKAALNKLAFHKLSFLGSALAPVADEYVVCFLLGHPKTPAGNPWLSAFRNYPYQNGI